MREIEELRKIAQVVQSKNGRMDAREREQASHLIASALANESSDPSVLLSSLEVFQSEAVAQAIEQSWPTLSGDRRELFSRWLPDPKSEKATRRIAILAAAVLEMDGVTALAWLGRLIPTNPKKKITREIYQILASVFFGSKPLKFVRLGDEGGDPENLVRVLNALLQVALDDHYAVETMARYRLVDDTLTIISKNNLVGRDGSKPILTRIEIETKRWPLALVQQLAASLKRRIPDAELLLSMLPTKDKFTLPIPNHVLHVGDAQPQSEERIRIPEDKTQINSTLEKHIASLTSQVEELRGLATLLNEEERLKNELERQLREKELSETSLHFRLKTMSDELENAFTKLKTASARIDELEQMNKLNKESVEIERQRLTQQITANASGRVEEFKNNLALVLSRLIRDLPARDTQLTADVGNIVFLQFHQFLDVMDGQGVRTRKGKGAV